MTLELAKAYISLLYTNASEGRISFEEARAIEDEVLPPCEQCGGGPIKFMDGTVAVCTACALAHVFPLSVQHTTEG